MTVHELELVDLYARLVKNYRSISTIGKSMTLLPNNWQIALNEELKKSYLAELKAFLAEEKAAGFTIYPPSANIFSALFKTDLSTVKAVIVGQDPYHGPGQAHGLSFSVLNGVTTPPSLKNIYKELQSDLGIPPANHGCLEKWAEQGVLLLNATLTVREGKPNSHAKKGWEQLTDAILDIVAKTQPHVVFLLWGKYAQEKCERIASIHSEKHLILKAPHPSPFSAHSGFLGCKHFSKTNAFLEKNGLSPIDWRLS